MTPDETINELQKQVDNLEWLVMKIATVLVHPDHSDSVKLERITKLLAPYSLITGLSIAEDKSFTAHDDATSNGCVMCGNEWKSLNQEGRCSTCEMIWNS